MYGHTCQHARRAKTPEATHQLLDGLFGADLSEMSFLVLVLPCLRLHGRRLSVTHDEYAVVIQWLRTFLH